MKKKLLLLASTSLLILFISSFKSASPPLVGKWDMIGIGTADPNLAKKMNNGDVTNRSEGGRQSVSKLMDMMEKGIVFEFKKDGVFNYLDKDGKTTGSGHYMLSPEGTTVTIDIDTDELIYSIKTINDKRVKLKSTKDFSYVELFKK